MKKRINKKGMSLIEMMMTTLLISFVSLLATTALLKGNQSTTDINHASYAQTVSSSLLNKISEELGKATSNVWISSDGQMIAFQEGVEPVILCTGTQDVSTNERYARFSGSDYLQIYYLEQLDVNKSVWSFSKKTYMGYVIQNMNFSYKVNENKQLIKVDLTLKDTQRNYTFHASKIVWLSALEEDDIQIQSTSRENFMQAYERQNS